MLTSPNQQKTPKLTLEMGLLDPIKAAAILQNPALYGQISFNDYLKLSAQHEPIVLAVLNNQECEEVFDGLALSVLGSIHESAALAIVNNEKYKTKLESIDLGRLAKRFKSVAEFILNDEMLRNQLKSYDIAEIAAAHPELGLKIQQDETLFGRLEYIHYGLFCKSSAAMAETLINLKKTYMEGVEIALIAKHHPDLALQCLSSAEMAAKFDTESLVFMGSESPEVAKAIMNTSRYFNILGPIGTARLLANHQQLALDFIESNHPLIKQFDKISITCITKNYASIAKALYQNETFQHKFDLNEGNLSWFRKSLGVFIPNAGLKASPPIEPPAELKQMLHQLKLTFGYKWQAEWGPRTGKAVYEKILNHLQSTQMQENLLLGHKNASVAVALLEKYADRLNGDDLMLLGQELPDIAYQILQNQAFVDRMTGFHLVMLCEKHPNLCEFALTNAQLQEKIAGRHAGILAMHTPAMFEYLIKNSNLFDKLTSKDIPLLCKTYLSATKITLGTPSLQEKISPSYQALLASRLDAVKVIRDTLEQKKYSTQQQEDEDAAETALHSPAQVLRIRPKAQSSTDSNTGSMSYLKLHLRNLTLKDTSTSCVRKYNI